MIYALASYLHTLDPVIFELGPIKPRWYGFAYLCGFLAAYVLLIKLARRGMLRLDSKKVPDLVFFACLVGVLIGGRLGFVLFYQPRLLGFDDAFPYWGVLKVWQGGMSAHGGIVFTILALVFFAWRQRVSTINLGDAAAMVVPLGLCFGRIANFINGELYGRIVPNGSLPWAAKFPVELFNPTNDQFAVTDAQRTGLILDVANNVPAFGKMIEAGQLNDVTAIQMIIKLAGSGNAFAREALMNVLPDRHPSQLYQAGLEGVLLFAIVWCIGWFWRKDGMASGAFLTFYPILRMIGEHYREGDSPQTIFGITASLGVWYSVPLVVGGLIYWGFFIARSQKRVWVAEKL